jgi:DNA-binding MarR family transcriptional regulator
VSCEGPRSRAAMMEQMRRLTRSVRGVLADSAGDVGLSENDFQALIRVVATDGVTGAELSRMLGMTSSSMTELADRLQRGGMIARTRSEADRRVVVLRPTARGRRRVDRALGPLLAAIGAVLDSLEGDDLEAVARFLDEVEHALIGIARR